MKRIVFHSLILVLFLSCNNSDKIAILPLAARYEAKFRNAKGTELNKTELNTIDRLLRSCINAANDSSQVLKVYNYGFIELKNYKRQYIPQIDSNGDKIVWINCFCDDYSFPNWKKEVLSVDDGDICFFNVEINLTKGTYGELYINTRA